jgi:hypothetical protein
MNTLVILPLQESMAQRGVGKNDQWQGYMNVLVINHAIIKSICIITVIIPPIIQFEADKPLD